MSTEDLYREEILEHFRNPLNFGKLSNYSISAKQANPFCGDEVEIFIKFDPNTQGVNRIPPLRWKVVDGISFVGKGCAISVAAASMITDYAKGKTKSQLTKFEEEDMLNLLGIKMSETRKKCALLALAVLQDCLYATESKSR